MNNTNIIISLRPSTEEELFGNASARDLEGINIDGSLTSFDAEWSHRVQQSYPDATIEWHPHQRTHALITARQLTPDPVDRTDDEAYIQRLAEELYDAGAIWIV